MNSKGETNVGLIVVLAIGVILGSIFIIAIADQSAILTETQEVANISVSSVNGTYTLPGQAFRSTVIFNVTNDIEIDAGNFTVTNYQNVNDEYTATLLVDTGNATLYGHGWLVSGTYEPSGYNTDSSNRTIIGLVILFFALAILFSVFPGIREWLGSK